MNPSTMVERAALEPCDESYRALYEACRDDALRAWTVEQRVSDLARLVSDFALCARAARLRAELVLTRLREALDPVRELYAEGASDLIERAIMDYYDARPR